MQPSREREAPDLGVRALVPFLLVTFGLAWGVLGSFIAFPDHMAARFGELSGRHPLFVLAVYAPALAGIGLVMRHAGVRGLRRYLSRLLLWRCSVGWYAFIVVGIPLVFFGAAGLKGEVIDGPFTAAAIAPLLGALASMLFLGPVEELGWRGVALPLLQRGLSPLEAGLVLGAIWGVWHWPAFLLSGTPQDGWAFAPFLLGSVAISVILTPMFNRSGGSLLLAVLYHFQLINPLWPDAQPYDMALFVGIAVIVTWVHRDRMLRRGAGVTTVIPATAGVDSSAAGGGGGAGSAADQR